MGMEGASLVITRRTMSKLQRVGAPIEAAGGKVRCLENYFLPGDHEVQIEAFVDYYNNQRYHESLSNVTPADA